MTKEIEEESVDRGDTLPDETEKETTEETTEEEGTSTNETKGTEGETEESEEEEESSEQMLPKSRYDSVKAKNNALQAKIERMEQDREQALEQARTTKGPEETSETPQNELVALDDKINDALLDGDKALASKYRKEQREIEHSLFQDELATTTQNATAQAREQVRLDTTIDFLEATYEQINPDDKGFDQGTVDELEGLRQAFEATKQYTASQALLKAAKYMFPDMPEPETTTTKAPSKAAAIKKATDAARKQPPDLRGTGQDADTGGIKDDIDPMKLTDKDLETLPATTLARLRGDIL